MRCTILENGNLLVQAANADRANIAQGLQRSYWGTLADLFAPYSCNGSFTPFDAGDANPFVGLTSAPCVAEALALHDDGAQTVAGRLWWFPDYQVRDPLDELKTKGRTVFALAAA